MSVTIAFKLSMPRCASWNGKWSGEGKEYVIVKTFRSKTDVVNANAILAHGSYHHSWSDGWMARIDVSAVDSRDAARLRRKSAGFCGYDWMVDNIINHGSTEDREAVNR